MARQDRYSDQSEYEDDRRTRDELVDDQVRKGGGSGSSAVRWFGVLLLFIAFVFMSFAASTPVTKNFYLFLVKIKINAIITKITNEFRFGVWGYCTTGIKNSFGIGKAKINTKLSKGGCHDRKLGWTFKDIPGMSDELQDAISAALTIAFVLHLVAAIAIFPALCVAMFGAAKRDVAVRDVGYSEKGGYGARDQQASRKRLRRRVFNFIFGAFILTMVVFILDVAGVVLTRNKVHKKSKGIAKLEFGPAFWFVVAAFGLVLLSFFMAWFDLVRSGRDVYEDDRRTGQRPASSTSEYSREDGLDSIPITPQDERKGGSRLR